MTKRFTEEQYQKIIDAWDAKKSYTETAESIVKMFIYDFKESWQFDIEQAFTLANPLTREWAHDKFVEKEKKYYWTSKDGTRSGKMHRRLYKGGFSKIRDIYVEDNYPKSENEKLTEHEVMMSIYNPEMFDREEA